VVVPLVNKYILTNYPGQGEVVHKGENLPPDRKAADARRALSYTGATFLSGFGFSRAARGDTSIKQPLIIS